MDIRWQDDTGDTFALRNEDRLVAYLHEYRPHWTEAQEHSEILPKSLHLFSKDALLSIKVMAGTSGNAIESIQLNDTAL